MTTELEKLLSIPREVTLPKSQIKAGIFEIKVSRLSDGAPLLPVFEAAAREVGDAMVGDDGKVSDDWAHAVITMVVAHSNEVKAFCAATCTLPVNDIEMLDLTDLISLFSECMKDNQAFFLPVTARALKRALHGKTLLLPSSVTVTDSATLETTQ